MRASGTGWILAAMLAGTVIATIVSALIGCRMLRKQFERAGIAQ